MKLQWEEYLWRYFWTWRRLDLGLWSLSRPQPPDVIDYTKNHSDPHSQSLWWLCAYERCTYWRGCARKYFLILWGTGDWTLRVWFRLKSFAACTVALVCQLTKCKDGTVLFQSPFVLYFQIVLFFRSFFLHYCLLRFTFICRVLSRSCLYLYVCLSSLLCSYQRILRVVWPCIFLMK